MTSLRVIAGRSGSGKTHRVLSEVRERAGSDPFADQLVIVPEQFSFETERQLLSGHGPEGLMATRVTSFSRLGHRLLSSAGKGHYRVLDRRGRAVLVRKLLAETELPDEFSGVEDRVGFAVELSDLLLELRQFGWSWRDLDDELLERARTRLGFDSDRSSAGQVLRLVRPLLKDYENKLEGEFLLDRAALLGELSSLAEADERLAGARVYLDNFSDYTELELSVLRALLKTAEQTTLTLNIDPALLDDPDKDSHRAWVFNPTLDTLGRLRRLAASADAGLEIERMQVETGEAGRFQSTVLADLERSVVEGQVAEPEQVGPAGDGLQVFTERDRTTEVERWARLIHRWTREEGLNYRDIVVMLRSPEPYREVIPAVFERWEIPFHLDRKRPLSSRPLARTVNTLLEAARDEFSRRSVIGLLRSGYLDLPGLKVDLLENAALELGIEKNQWFSDWSELLARSPDYAPLAELETGEDDEDSGMDEEGAEETGEADERRRKLQRARQLAGFLQEIQEEVLRPVKQWKLGGRRTVAEWVAGLRDLLAELPLDEPDPDDPLAPQTERKVAELFTDLVELAGEVEVPLDEFVSLTASWLEADSVGQVPPGLDAVLVSEVQRGRIPEVRRVIVGGLAEGEFPHDFAPEGLVGDRLREAFSAGDRKFGVTQSEKQQNELYFFYVALTRPREQLVLTRPLSDADGASLGPSPYLEDLEDLFEAMDVAPELPSAERSLKDQVRDARIPEHVETALAGWMTGRARGIRTFEELTGTEVTQADEIAAELARRSASEQSEEVDIEQFTPLLRPPGALELDEGVIETLHGAEQLHTSVSRLETFAKCPFRYLAERELELEERPEFSVHPLKTGLFFHRVLEEFYHRLIERGLDPAGLSERQLEELLDESVRTAREELGGVYDEAEGRFAQIRHWLKHRILNFLSFETGSVWSNTDFRPADTEWEFGMGGAEPLKIDTEAGEVSLHGKIDRVEVLEERRGEELVKRALAVDYKTSPKRISEDDFLSGLELQLAVYLLALEELAGMQPAGGFYLGLEGRPASADSPVDAREESADRRRRGFYLEGLQERIDRSDDGVIVSSHWSSFDPMEGPRFRRALELVREWIGDYGARVLSGEAGALPLEHGGRLACDHCAMAGVCRIDRRVDETRRLGPDDRKPLVEPEEDESEAAGEGGA